jgi:hypothetical protein
VLFLICGGDLTLALLDSGNAAFDS